jgi:hypothetical protein
MVGIQSMKPPNEVDMTIRRQQLRMLSVAAAFALAVCAFVTSARAFTFEDQSGGNGGGKNDDTSMFYNSRSNSDPGDRMTSRFDDGRKTIIKQGNTTFYIGGAEQSYEQRYSPDRLFDRNGGPGDNYGR